MLYVATAPSLLGRADLVNSRSFAKTLKHNVAELLVYGKMIYETKDCSMKIISVG